MKHLRPYLPLMRMLICTLIGIGIGWWRFAEPQKPAPSFLRPPDNLSSCGPEESNSWTCSMHPQVSQHEPGACPLCGMQLIRQVKSLHGQAHVHMTSQMQTQAAIKVMPVQTSTQHQTLLLSGTLQMPDNQKYQVSSRYPGQVINFHDIVEGAYVEKGQVIATIYSPELIAAQKEFFDATCFRVAEPNVFILARKKLRRWDFAESHILALEKGDDPTTHFEIRAEASGYVRRLLLSEGTYIKEGQALVELWDPSQLWISCQIPENDLAWVKPRQKFQLRTAALPGKEFETVISFISPWVDQNKQGVEIRAHIRNMHHMLKPGMLIQGALSSMYQEGSHPVIPRSAVLWTGRKSYVYIRPEPKRKTQFTIREVKLGKSSEHGYEVLEGLMPGMELVVSGAFQLDAAAQLSGKASLMQPPKTTPKHEYMHTQHGAMHTHKPPTPAAQPTPMPYHAHH